MTEQQKENVKKWVAALRSGKYQQGRGYLNKGNKLCCLGVACELAIEEGVAIERVSEWDAIVYERNREYPPDVVVKWLGLTDHSGGYLEVSEITGAITKVTSLATKNDGGHPFEEIANIIESNPKGLFVAEVETN